MQPLKTIEIEKDLKSRTQDGILWAVSRVSEKDDSPDGKARAAERACELLMCVEEGIKRDAYLDSCRKIIGVNAKQLQQALDKKLKQQSAVASVTEADVPLPASVDRDFFDKWGFYEYQGKYWFFSGSKKKFVPTTSFTIEPLFHIKNKKDDRRLIMLKNETGHELVDLPSKATVSFQTFKEELVHHGWFMMNQHFTSMHFSQMMNAMGANFPVAKPISTLGQQREGFFAFANGILTEDGFEGIDEYGMVKHRDQYKNVLGEKIDKQEYYFLPAFSKIYKDVREDEDEYQNERKLVYKESPITLKEWMDLFMKTFGRKKGEVGIAFLVATCFRDLFIDRFTFFPLMFCHGEKGSGKSAYAEMIQNFFFVGEDAFSLTSGTDVGFSRRNARVKNVPNFLDEYTDDMDEKRFQALKNGWNGTGREIGFASHDKRTLTDKVHRSLVICGQYLSTRDDNALTNRCILVEFLKRNDRPEEMQRAFNKLMSTTKKGINSLVLDIIIHRDKVKKELNKTFEEMKRKVNKELGEFNFNERTVQNYSALLSCVELLKDDLDFPFTWNAFFKSCVEAIKDESDLINDSEGVSTFWQIMSNFIDRDIVREGVHFKFDTPLELWHEEKREKKRWTNDKREELIYVCVQDIHGEYTKEHYQQFRKNGIAKRSLYTYFRARSSFVGWVKGTDFTNKKTSAMVFKYSGIQELGIELKRHASNQPNPPTGGPSIPEEKDSVRKHRPDNQEDMFSKDR